MKGGRVQAGLRCPCSLMPDPCSVVVDNVGHLAHLHARATSFALVSRAPLSKIEPFKAQHRVDRALALLVLQRHPTPASNAAPTFKRGFGFHPLTCYLDETREALAAKLRAGNAGSGAHRTRAAPAPALSRCPGIAPGTAIRRRLLLRGSR